MNRRDIIKSLFSLSIALVPNWTCANCDSSNNVLTNCKNCGAPEYESETKEENVQLEDYRGFRIVWSGWRTSPDHEKITGFYIAKEKEISFSSCTGGITDEYRIGMFLNTQVLADHNFITLTSTEIEKKEEQRRALNKIIEIINDHLDNPKKKEEPEYTFGFTGFKPL